MGAWPRVSLSLWHAHAHVGSELTPFFVDLLLVADLFQVNLLEWENFVLLSHLRLGSSRSEQHAINLRIEAHTPQRKLIAVVLPTEAIFHQGPSHWRETRSIVL